MFNFFSRIKKAKTSANNETHATGHLHAPTINQLIQNVTAPIISSLSPSASSAPTAVEAAAAAAAAVGGATAQSDVPALFMEAYDCAKNNHNWNKVSSTVSNHPDWLIRIPQGRRWTMLHQIVYCGNVTHLNEVLAYQISNQEFRLLFKALDDKTVREVAMERAHIHPQMLRRIERLVAIDQLLANAKDGKWELVRQFLRQQPDIINEKPPYKKYYLAHFLASTGQLNMFIDLSRICQFRLDLTADNKSIEQIARENNHIQFAEYIENLRGNAMETTVAAASPLPSLALPHEEEEEQQHVEDNSDPSYSTPQPFFSQTFYNDPGIMIVSFNSNSIGNMFSSDDEPLTFVTTSSSHNPHTSNGVHFATHSLLQAPYSPITTYPNDTYPVTTDHRQHHPTAPEPPKKMRTADAPGMTDEEQAFYERTVVENARKFSADTLLNAVTCCITKAILRDPVVAADGFTYEREAIINWFQHSSRSPMTNKELESHELKPNHAIKSILQSLAEPKKDEKTMRIKDF